MDKSEYSLNHDTCDVAVTCHPVTCDPGMLISWHACIAKINVAYVYVYYTDSYGKTPTPRELRLYVRDHVQEKWEELADELGLEDDDDVSKKFKDKKTEYATDKRKMTFEVLKLWVNHYKITATWQSLINALDRLHLVDALNSIKEYLSSKCIICLIQVH